MRAVVVGGSGQIGGWLLRVLRERGHEAIGTYATAAYPGLVPLDAAALDISARWVRDQRSDVVFYPAGFTWVDGCERDPARARSSNLDQPLNLARAAADSGARFVYFSTDYVFDGRGGPYSEGTPVNPLSAYGLAKSEAERALAGELGDRVLTLRTSWVFGPERQGKNFAYQLIRTLAAGRDLSCPSDQVSNPSYGPDVARSAVVLTEQGRSGLAHAAGPDVMDRVTFARLIAEEFGLDPERVIGRTTSELGPTTPRPLRGGLLSPRLDAWLPRAVRPVREALDDFRRRVAANEGWADPFTPP